MWIEYGKTWEQFKKDSLNNSGTVVRVKQGEADAETLLIGDMNESGGACECCGWVNASATVLAYKVLEDGSRDQA
jgi:hypothetical protein